MRDWLRKWLGEVIPTQTKPAVQTQPILSRPEHQSLPPGSALRQNADRFDREHPLTDVDLETLQELRRMREAERERAKPVPPKPKNAANQSKPKPVSSAHQPPPAESSSPRSSMDDPVVREINEISRILHSGMRYGKPEPAKPGEGAEFVPGLPEILDQQFTLAFDSPKTSQPSS
jgi:hypothetical protein